MFLLVIGYQLHFCITCYPKNTDPVRLRSKDFKPDFSVHQEHWFCSSFSQSPQDSLVFKRTYRNCNVLYPALSR